MPDGHFAEPLRFGTIARMRPERALQRRAETATVNQDLAWRLAAAVPTAIPTPNSPRSAGRIPVRRNPRNADANWGQPDGSPKVHPFNSDSGRSCMNISKLMTSTALIGGLALFSGAAQADESVEGPACPAR